MSTNPKDGKTGVGSASSSEAQPQPTTGDPVASNVERVVRLEQAALLKRSAAERLGDRVVSVAGTPAFALFHVAWFAFWILANLAVIPGLPAFDPYPFGFLTFVVSLEAIFLTIAVLIIDNRAARHADRRAHIDLQVNLLAEQESTATLQLVRRVAEHLGVDATGDRKIQGLARETDLRDVLEKLDQRLPDP